MIAAAQGSGTSLGVAYYRRGYPSIQEIRRLLQEGAVGEPLTMSINGEFPTSHRIDLVHFLFGDIETLKVVAGGTGGYSFERMAGRIELKTGSGVEVVMADTWTETGMPESLRITGDKGEIYLTDPPHRTAPLPRARRGRPRAAAGQPRALWSRARGGAARRVRSRRRLRALGARGAGRRRGTAAPARSGDDGPARLTRAPVSALPRAPGRALGG